MTELVAVANPAELIPSSTTPVSPLDGGLTPEPDLTSPTHGLARWANSLPVHAVALTLVLLALAPVAGLRWMFSSDEGGAIAQVAWLADGHGWTMRHPFPQADPSGLAFPLQYANRSRSGYAPFAKHTVYAAMLVPLYRIGGVGALIGLSMAGTVAAALLSAFLARLLDRRLVIPTLWAVGVGSPLLIDGYLVIAHTLGAALAVGGVLAVLRARRRFQLWPLVVTAVCFGLGALLRNEMVLFGMAVVLVLGLHGIRHRSLPDLIAAGSVGAASVGAYVLDPKLTSWALGGSSTAAFTIAQGDGSFLSSRMVGAAITVLLPSYFDFATADMLLLVSVGFGVAAVLIAWRRSADRAGVMLLAGAAAVAALARLWLAPGLVPGLMLACPLLPLGLLVLDEQDRRREPVRLLIGITAVFSIGVLLTQYPSGGSREWGWRYVAIALPVIVPVAIFGLHRLTSRLDVSLRRCVVASLVVISLAVSVSGVVAARDWRAQVGRLASATRRAARGTDPGDGSKPVVLSTFGPLGRYAWNHLDEARWLTVDPARLDGYLRRLQALGIRQFVLVPVDDDAALPVIARRFTVVKRQQVSGRSILVLRSRDELTRR